MTADDLDAKIAAAAEMILASRRLVVFTGAGVSAAGSQPSVSAISGVRGVSGHDLIPMTSPYKNSSRAKRLEENNGKY